MKSGSFPQNLNRGEKFFFFALMGAAAIIVFGSLFGLLVQFLWNATLVPLAGAGEISFWQAIGVLVLAKLFFGFGAGSAPKPPKHKKRRSSDSDKDLLKQTSFREYWEQEGKAAYENYKTKQENSDSATRED